MYNVMKELCDIRDKLRKENNVGVLKANQHLIRYRLVTSTWNNVS